MDKVIKLHENTISKINKFRTHKRETWDDILNTILKKLKGEKNEKHS